MLETLHAFFFETTQSFHGRKRNTENKNTEETNKNMWKKPGLHNSSNKRYIGFETSAKSHQRNSHQNISPSSQATYTKRRRRQQQQWI
jgi:hypothetical protein